MAEGKAAERPTDLDAEALLELAAIVYEQETLESVLDRVAHIAKRGIPGAEEVSVTLIRDGKPFTVASTGRLALDADELQYERDYGPCVDAGRAGVVLRVEDMRQETRWPDYAAAVAARGVLSSLSIPLPVQDAHIGALNIYSRSPGSFPDRDVPLAQTIASYAAVAVHNAHTFTKAGELARQLAEAMESRAVIEQAKGILMHEQGCDADAAFATLARVSQQANVKLRDIAAQIVARAARPRRR
ncbi:MAG TPA: GAF and ANTAR domain-containing protein [Mycobacteriales bacterium]|jgi:GAF domain-containing protein|nr:GAF and ANTAR domain-containing protein [Mycobacteriales bacterium]